MPLVGDVGDCDLIFDFGGERDGLLDGGWKGWVFMIAWLVRFEWNEWLQYILVAFFYSNQIMIPISLLACRDNCLAASNINCRIKYPLVLFSEWHNPLPAAQ